MTDPQDTGKRSADDAGGRGKRRRIEPDHGDANMQTLLRAAGLAGGAPTDRPGQQGLGRARRADSPPAVADPVVLYRRGRYVPTAAGHHHQMPVPDFLRAVSPHGDDQQAPETGDPGSRRLSPPREAPRSRPPSPAPLDRRPAAGVEAVRVCPQCTAVPLGPGPVVDGKPTYPVCENCRQANVRREVLRGIAAQALVELGQRVVAPRAPGPDDRARDVRGLVLNGLGRLPRRPQELTCARCRRPGVPLAPGRRRCVECICILIAFGPDEGEEQAAAGAGQRQQTEQRQRRAGLEQQQRQQQQPQDEHWNMCDGCFGKPVPPGERKCPDCAARPALAHRACVICEHKRALAGQSCCSDCQVRSSASLGVATMATSSMCNGRGYHVDETTDGLCWGCRASGAPTGAAAGRGRQRFYGDY